MILKISVANEIRTIEHVRLVVVMRDGNSPDDTELGIELMQNRDEGLSLKIKEVHDG